MSVSETRKKWGTVRRFITHIAKHITELEGLEDRAEACHRAQRFSTRITELDAKFKTLQYNLISAIDETNEEAISSKQEALDKHDKEIDTLSIRLE